MVGISETAPPFLLARLLGTPPHSIVVVSPFHHVTHYLLQPSSRHENLQKLRITVYYRLLQPITALLQPITAYYSPITAYYSLNTAQQPSKKSKK